jgi:hypothetical protein
MSPYYIICNTKCHGLLCSLLPPQWLFESAEIETYWEVSHPTILYSMVVSQLLQSVLWVGHQSYGVQKHSIVVDSKLNN